ATTCLQAYGLLGRLLRGEASPLMAPGVSRVLGLLQVSHGLTHPVTGAVCHAESPLTGYYAALRAQGSRDGETVRHTALPAATPLSRRNGMELGPAPCRSSLRGRRLPRVHRRLGARPRRFSGRSRPSTRRSH